MLPGKAGDKAQVHVHIAVGTLPGAKAFPFRRKERVGIQQEYPEQHDGKKEDGEGPMGFQAFDGLRQAGRKVMPPAQPQKGEQQRRQREKQGKHMRQQRKIKEKREKRRQPYGQKRAGGAACQ